MSPFKPVLLYFSTHRVNSLKPSTCKINKYSNASCEIQAIYMTGIDCSRMPTGGDGIDLGFRC